MPNDYDDEKYFSSLIKLLDKKPDSPKQIFKKSYEAICVIKFWGEK
jgi:hypothetical protein